MEQADWKWRKWTKESTTQNWKFEFRKFTCSFGKKVTNLNAHVEFSQFREFWESFDSFDIIFIWIFMNIREIKSVNILSITGRTPSITWRSWPEAPCQILIVSHFKWVFHILHYRGRSRKCYTTNNPLDWRQGWAIGSWYGASYEAVRNFESRYNWTSREVNI